MLTIALACAIPLIGAGGASAGEWTETASVPGSSVVPKGLETLLTPDRGTFAFWIEEIGGDRIVRSVKIGADGSTGPVQSLSPPGQDAKDPVAAVALSGRVTVAWVRSNGTTNDLIQSVGVSRGGAVGPVIDRSAPGNFLQNSEQPEIAVTPDGTVALAWRRFNGPFWVAQALTIPEGGAATPVRDVSLQRIATNLPPPEGNTDSTHPGTPVNLHANSNSPDVVALPDNTFRMAWTRESEPASYVGFEDPLETDNVLSAPLSAAGIPGESRPVFVDNLGWFANATGDPKGLSATTNGTGDTLIAWNRYFRSEHQEGEEPNTYMVLDGIQRGAELISVKPDGQASFLKMISSFWANISDIEMESSLGRASVSWNAEAFGAKVAQWAPLGVNGRGGTFDVPASPLGELTRPDGGIGPGRWVTAGRYDGIAGLPGVSQAFVYNLTPNMAVRAVKDLSGTDLKSSEQPQITVDDLGVPTVVFYGVDHEDEGSLRFTRYSDPGIAVAPVSIQFGGGLVKLVNPPRAITIQSTGSTANRISAIEITGPGAGSYRMLNREECLGTKVSQAPCDLLVAFAPAAVGPVPDASVKVESDAGSFSTALSGTGVARTRLDLKVRPKRQRARPGAKKRINAVVRNTGGIPATGVRVCFRGNRKVLRPFKACGSIGTLEVGGRRVVQYLPEISRKVISNRLLPVSVRLKVENATPRRSTAYIRVKPRR